MLPPDAVRLASCRARATHFSRAWRAQPALRNASGSAAIPRRMAQKRFGLGSLLTIAGAVLIAAALPLTWYHAQRTTHTELTGWAVFTHLRIWLVVAAALSLLTALLPQGKRTVIVRATLGILAGGPVLRRIIQPPGHGVALDNRAGLWVALAGALAIIVGGLLSAGRRVAEHYQWDLPGMSPARALPPAPPPAPAGGGGIALARDEEIVDAEIVN